MRLFKYTASMTCKLIFGMGQTLVLNASYEPLNITSWQRAVILMIKGKAESLKKTIIPIHSGKKLPTVIRAYYVKVPFREVASQEKIYLRDNNTCQYCNHRGIDLSIDHVLPRSRGGTDNWENVTTACLRCNVHKESNTRRSKYALRAQAISPIK